MKRVTNNFRVVTPDYTTKDRTENKTSWITFFMYNYSWASIKRRRCKRKDNSKRFFGLQTIFRVSHCHSNDCLNMTYFRSFEFLSISILDFFSFQNCLDDSNLKKLYMMRSAQEELLRQNNDLNEKSSFDS